MPKIPQKQTVSKTAADVVVDPTPGLGDFTDIQSAISSLPSTGSFRVYVRAGTYAITSSISFASRTIHLIGSGPNDTIIDIGANVISAFSLSFNGPHFVIENLQVKGQNAAGQAAILAGNSQGGTGKATFVRNVRVEDVPILVKTVSGGTPTFRFVFDSVFFDPTGTASANQKIWEQNGTRFSFVEFKNCRFLGGSVPLFPGAGSEWIISDSDLTITGDGGLRCRSLQMSKCNIAGISLAAGVPVIDFNGGVDTDDILALIGNKFGGAAGSGASYVKVSGDTSDHVFIVDNGFVNASGTWHVQNAGDLSIAIIGNRFNPSVVNKAVDLGSSTVGRHVIIGNRDLSVDEGSAVGTVYLGNHWSTSAVLADFTGSAQKMGGGNEKVTFGPSAAVSGSVTVFERFGAAGLSGGGTIKNEGGGSGDTMDVTEEVDDFFGVINATVVTPVGSGDTLSVDLMNNVGTARPPYKRYKVTVAPQVTDTTATFHGSIQGAFK